ncbi:hypothetical protein [Sediminibacillus halophilus]|uniref:Uncharacterized protein n=1 Tax=Sediminibacillus halophilus TaxID=482461 RepID=A0A1G9X5Z2_9BACI|nr:hypothetical protein [Sediminibacillus halophilus]SDM91926.1 hypothetical protein SAMN05216244_3759 [Sediminibacillus halophilus]
MTLLCSGCAFAESDNLIPDYNYTQLFVEKRLSSHIGDVEYKKVWDKDEIKEIKDLLNSVPVESPGDQQKEKIKSQLNEKGTYIFSFYTQKDLDNRTTESVFYLALLQSGQIVYSDPKDHEMSIRLVSAENKPELVKKIIEKIY